MVIDPFVYDIIKRTNNNDLKFIQEELTRMGIEADFEDIQNSIEIVCEAVMVKESEEN